MVTSGGLAEVGGDCNIYSVAFIFFMKVELNYGDDAVSDP